MVTEPARGDRVRLQELLGQPGTAWLVERVRERMARGRPLVGPVSTPQPTQEQRRAALRLVGTPRRTSQGLRVDLTELDRVLRASLWPAGLADAVCALGGPLTVRAEQRRRRSDAWGAAVRLFVPALQAHPRLAAWWEQWCATGSLRRVARAEAARTGAAVAGDVPELDADVALAEVAADVVRVAGVCVSQLPSAGEPLAVFARRTLGDAHALDRGRPVELLVRAAAEQLGDLQPGTVSPREAWHRVGLLVSAVSSTVLCLGVRGGNGAAGPGQATTTALDAWREHCVPAVLTLDQVRSGGVAPLGHDEVAYVCENPSVVEVVAGALCDAQRRPAPVLVCTSGQAGAAVVDLLAQLTARGAGVRYHGDFDWAGLRIADSLRSKVPWHPWRFGASDYVEAATRTDLMRLRLRGPAAASPWDEALSEVMAEHGQAIEEEEVVDLLVQDLLA
ncbi:hypothetical protein BH24ACT12_BH24ACT12_11430 [soil metagenome]